MPTIEDIMPLSDRQRFELLATETNHQFAHAVVYGGLSRAEASAFCMWVIRTGRSENKPADNLAEFLS